MRERLWLSLAAATLVAWILAAIGLHDLGATNADGNPYGGWAISWLLLVLGALLAALAIGRARTGRWAVLSVLTTSVVALVPLVTGVLLVRIASDCASSPFGYGGFGVDRCSPSAASDGWVALWIGFGILCLAVILAAIMEVLSRGRPTVPDRPPSLRDTWSFFNSGGPPGTEN